LEAAAAKVGHYENHGDRDEQDHGTEPYELRAVPPLVVGVKLLLRAFFGRNGHVKLGRVLGPAATFIKRRGRS
jgi:hypothetical protein